MKHDLNRRNSPAEEVVVMSSRRNLILNDLWERFILHTFSKIYRSRFVGQAVCSGSLCYIRMDLECSVQSITLEATTRDYLVSTINPFSVTIIRPLLTNTLFSKSFNVGSATRKVYDPAFRTPT